MSTSDLTVKSIAICLAMGGTSVANAQASSYRIVGWSNDSVKLTANDNDLTRPIEVGTTISAKSAVCAAATQSTAVLLLIQPAEGGEARHITVPGGGKRCPIVDVAWREAGLEGNRWLKTLYNVLRADADSARVSASTAGTSTRSTNGEPDPVDAEPCLIQPVAPSKWVFVPPGETSLSFFTTMPEGTVTKLVDGDGKPLQISKVQAGKVSLDEQKYEEEKRYQVRFEPVDGNVCEFSIEARQAPQMLLDSTLQSSEAYASAAALLLNDPKQARWHAYTLQTLNPRGRDGSTLKAAVWEWWWAKQHP